MTTIDWTTLRHAYGPAGDIPALLARARSASPPVDYRSEPWFTLWSSLYHQDDIYSASYAAVADGKLTIADLVFRGERIRARAILDADGDEYEP